MFQKFAKLQVLEVKSSSKRAKTASLAKFADFNDYRTDDGFVYVRVRAISSRVNKNHDGWPSAELEKSWRTFIGKPIFVDHHNSDPKRARGVIVDAALHTEDLKTAALDPYYADAPESHKPPTWIELLLEVDAKRFPRLAHAIVNSDIDGVSMGANVEMSKCSHCGNEAYSPQEFCKHISAKGAYFDYTGPDGVKTSKRSYEDCHGIGFFEISFVFDPADDTALVSDIKTSKRQMVAAIQAEGAVNDPYGEGGLYEDPMSGSVVPHPPVGEDMGDYRDPQSDEMERVYKWRMEQFLRLGYPPEMAEEMAANETDYHPYEDMIGKGATPDQAHSILSSNDFGNFDLKTADQNPIPQSEMTTAPEKVDTLRQEQVCPICGSDMEDGICEVCNYEEPPEGFDNPDLQQAHDVDQQIHQQDAEQAAQGQQGTPNDVQPASPAGPTPMPGGAMPAVSSTGNNHVAGAVSNEKTSANNGRVNTQERPILPVTRQLSDKPINPKTVSKSPNKVESNERKDSMTTTTIKTADGATPQGDGVQAENRVDVLGVGAVSGDPLSGIKHENIETDTGDFVAPHTDTWSGGEGDSLGQHDPVTSEPFEGGGQGTGNAVGVSDPPPHNSAVTANKYVQQRDGKWVIIQKGTGKVLSTHDSEEKANASFRAMEMHKHQGAEDANDLGGPIGESAGFDGSAEQGGSTWDESASGFPDHDPSRVDLNAPLKEEVGQRTQTDPGEEFRSQKHTEPVTKDENANSLGGPIGVAVSKALARQLKSIKVAEAEIALGLLPADDKFDRVAELEATPEEALDAQIETLSKVKTAGLQRKTASSDTPRRAGRMPSFSRTASFDIEAHSVGEDPFADSIF